MAVARARKPKVAPFSCAHDPDRAPEPAYRRQRDGWKRRHSCTVARAGFPATNRRPDPAGQRRARKIDAVPGKDLRLTIERRVIAVFGDQHLRKQRRRRHAAGDWTFRSRRLGDRPAGATSVFWTGDAQDAKLRGSPVQHLAHALADRMERTAAARARLAVDIEPDILARQMIGQRFAPGPRLGRRFLRACFDRRTAFANARDIAVEVLESERHLVGVEAFGAASELRPLELLDDELKALDLAVAAFDDGRHVAHQMVQKRRIDRQIVEIDSHAQFYFERPSKPSIFSIVCLMFSVFSTSHRRSPDALWEPSSRCPRSAWRAAPD